MAAPRSKSDLRAIARAARATCDPAWGIRLAGHLLTSCPPPPGTTIAGFLPLAHEIDITPLLLALAGRGHPIALPATPPPGNPLTFHRWRPGARLLPGRFGTRHPDGEPLVPDLLFVPLLAFDAAFHRLGYGAGYYDRTLAAPPNALAIGCAFAAQQIDAVPTDPYDRPMTAIATERGLLTSQ
ncbi:MAG: hypothetical protein NVS2B11_13320 [Acetobacteraceae bacterium]